MATAVASGVEAAFRVHYADVFRYFTRRTRDRVQAEDLAQDVFLAAVSALGDLPPEVPILAWLYLVASRRLADYARRERRFTPMPLSDDVCTLDGPGERASADALRLALSHLPAGQQRVVVLHLLRGCRFAEVAALLGMREAAVKKRFQRGVEALRLELGHEGVEM